MVINIHSEGHWPADILSNFAATPFVIDDVQCASSEGFIQALKFPDPAVQRKICQLAGTAAKVIGKKAANRIRREQKVWWQGKEFGFRSREHFQLIERALRAKFSQNEEARRALETTRGCILQHDLGRPESPFTSLPANIFIHILETIRSEL